MRSREECCLRGSKEYYCGKIVWFNRFNIEDFCGKKATESGPLANFVIRDVSNQRAIFPFKTSSGSFREIPIYLPIFFKLATASMGVAWRTKG
jgi:hypothetical protein